MKYLENSRASIKSDDSLHFAITLFIYPSNIQKQNVSLVLKLFNETNITALKHIAKYYPSDFHTVNDTCNFIEIFVTWWKIFWKYPGGKYSEGKRFNDKYREAIKMNSDFHWHFLMIFYIG